MIRKFLAAPAVTITTFLVMTLAGATTLCAQQDSAQQPSGQPAQAQPQQQPEQPSSQEPQEEETSSSRKTKPKEYKNWTFNAGGGASLMNATTETFVRNGGVAIGGGVARNYSKYFGLQAQFQWNDLPLRTSALRLAQAPSGTSYLYSIMIDPVINIPVTKVWGGYAVIGGSFYHRGGTLDSSTVIRGTGCSPFYHWFGTCRNGSIPETGNFLSTSQNDFGFNAGFGVTRKIRGNVDFYAEFRYLGSSATSLRPITIGFRF
jgi:hypothetical protein